MGAACLAAAAWFAVHPIGLHVAAMSSASPGSSPKPLHTESVPAGLWPPLVFRWQAGSAQAPFTWVLLDAGYEEIARREGVFTSGLVPDAAVRELLRDGQTCHWYVLATAAGVPTKSNLETLRDPLLANGH